MKIIYFIDDEQYKKRRKKKIIYFILKLQKVIKMIINQHWDTYMDIKDVTEKDLSQKSACLASTRT